MSTPIPEADYRKPDPSEPWRYVCPDCGGQVWGRAHHRKYECKACPTSWRKRELRDKKLFGGRQ